MGLAVLAILFGVMYSGKVFADQGNVCAPHNVCVHSGDHLKYAIQTGIINSSIIYSFGNMINPESINVTETYYLGKDVENDTFVLSLKTGYGHDKQGNIVPFVSILPVPIQYNQSDIVISQELKDYNGFKRTVLIATESNTNGSSDMAYDTQTGVLLSAHSVGMTKFLGKPITVTFSNNLIDTDIISSDSNYTQPSKSIIIPAWVKTNAGWWASSEISDDDFVKGIQYLVSNGIMQIPHGSSGNNTTHD
ncbi:MAG: hypothetical protein KGI08_06595, partial [Thaumarchaeota archaeon]|nr:hypothetical protein [Nitrososphaerota archaeon]